MSRTVRLVPTKIYRVDPSNIVVNNESGLLTDIDSSTYATIYPQTSYPPYVFVGGFDLSGIPENCVSSYSVKFKSRNTSGTVTSSTKIVYNGDNVVDDQSSLPYSLRNYASVSSFDNPISWSELAAIGENLNIKVPLVQNAYNYIYGVEIEVTYDPPVNKVVYGTTVLVDLTADTVTAATLMQGYTAHDKSGALITGTASGGGGGDGYILTTVCPEQTITPNSDRIAYPVGSFDYEVGEFYLVTFDGVEYVTSCALCWETNHVIGDTRVIWNDVVTVMPFCAITTSVTDKEVYCRDTNTHTIKVEHLELVSPTVLTTKSITANGTYTASSDNADGYSSVTVNVSGGGGTYQAKTNINPTTSSQTIRPDSGYDALSSVQINAMPSGTAGTPSAIKGAVSNHSVSVTPSVTNTTGYITGGTKTGTAVSVGASELVSGSETKTSNGTYDVTNLASLVVAIPIVTYHTSSSAPTSSQGSDGDLWLVTA